MDQHPNPKRLAPFVPDTYGKSFSEQTSNWPTTSQTSLSVSLFEEPYQTRPTSIICGTRSVSLPFVLTAAPLPFSIRRCLSGGLHPSGWLGYLSRPLRCRLITS